MSNQVFVNPEEIGKFINEIKIFLETLETATVRLNKAFENLSSSWQDRKRAEFEEQYNEFLRFLKMCKDSVEEKKQYLNELKIKAEIYLSSKNASQY